MTAGSVSRLSRHQAFDILDNAEEEMLRLRGLVRALEMMAAGVTDREQRDALETMALALKDTADSILDTRERVWAGLNPSHELDSGQGGDGDAECG